MPFPIEEARKRHATRRSFNNSILIADRPPKKGSNTTWRLIAEAGEIFGSEGRYIESGLAGDDVKLVFKYTGETDAYFENPDSAMTVDIHNIFVDLSGVACRFPDYLEFVYLALGPGGRQVTHAYNCNSEFTLGAEVEHGRLRKDDYLVCRVTKGEKQTSYQMFKKVR